MYHGSADPSDQRTSGCNAMTRNMRAYSLGGVILVGVWLGLIGCLALAHWAGLTNHDREWPSYLLGLAAIAAAVELYRRKGLRLRHALPAGLGILIVLVAIFGGWA